LTASAGSPNATDERVFTSTMTSTAPSSATMSISPSEQRQLRSRIVRPASVRYAAAICSPNRPTASLTRIPVTLPEPDRP
jgi:hypothetical protein